MRIKGFRLAPTEKGRLKQLKAFLRHHAARIHMNLWLEGESEGKDVYTFRKELALHTTTTQRLAKFEACGTACCIGGACEVLTGFFAQTDAGRKAANMMGVRGPVVYSDAPTSDLKVFHTMYWPEYIRAKYDTARVEQDYPTMAEAAIEAIDYFNARIV